MTAEMTADQVLVGFGVAFDWLIGRLEYRKQFRITFDSLQLKTPLN